MAGVASERDQLDVLDDFASDVKIGAADPTSVRRTRWVVATSTRPCIDRGPGAVASAHPIAAGHEGDFPHSSDAGTRHAGGSVAVLPFCGTCLAKSR